MSTIFVEGKEIEVPDKEDINRPPPSREYEPIRADFFDLEKMVEESEAAWKRNRIAALVKSGVNEEAATSEVENICFTPEFRESVREETITLINETIEIELEKTELYRNYTVENCQKLIDKYGDLAINKASICGDLIEKINPLKKSLASTSFTFEEDHYEANSELEELYYQWSSEDAKRQKYQLMTEEFILMREEMTKNTEKK